MKKSKGKLNARQRELLRADEEMQQRHANAPKLGAKYGVAKSMQSTVQQKRAAEKRALAERLRETRATPSLNTTASSTGSKLPERYSGDMAQREAEARKRKHVVAPIANKMGYGLITDAEHLKTMGKKT